LSPWLLELFKATESLLNISLRQSHLPSGFDFLGPLFGGFSSYSPPHSVKGPWGQQQCLPSSPIVPLSTSTVLRTLGSRIPCQMVPRLISQACTGFFLRPTLQKRYLIKVCIPRSQRGGRGAVGQVCACVCVCVCVCMCVCV
jgi:hypothetical protein